MYSNVSVYEMEVNGVAVMRRRSDGWLNATQILKVAGVEKGKRTKVLEKEILNGEHEKVQGGYGKYQGTWISYARGVEFCRQYHVEQLLRPLLEYDLGQDGANAVQGMETPTKEQAMAAQRKRMYGNSDGRSQGQGGGGTFFKNMSSTAASAVNALNRTRVDSPSRGMDGRRSVGPRRPSQQNMSQENMFLNGSQQSMHSMASQDSFSMIQGASYADFPSTEGQEPPRKKFRPSPQAPFGYDGMDIPMQEGGSPTEPNQSFFSQQSQSFMAPGNDGIFGLRPLPPPRGPLEEQKKEHLLDLFIDPQRTDFDDHPAFLTLSGEEFEYPIDGSCNTALHWAATLARIPLVKKLLEKGFNMQRTNSGGETALIAACQARNNLDQGSFPELLELLGPSIDIRDGRGRTLLHHIAVSSAMKGRAAVGRYYLESLLEFVVRQGSATNSQEAGMSFGLDGAKALPMTLARFMTEVVNAQDKSGDTALNLAARTSTTSIIDQLIEVGADPHIVNRGGLAPVDFGFGNDTNPSQASHLSMLDGPIGQTSSSQHSFAEAQSELMTCKSQPHPPNPPLTSTAMRDTLTACEADFQTELRDKQDNLDKTNAALKESGTALADERRRLEDLQSRVRERDELEAKIKNLQRSASELKSQLNQPPDHQSTIAIGEADRGLDFDGRLAALEHVFNTADPSFSPANPNLLFTPEQSSILRGFERDSVLRGRANAYAAHNASLKAQAKGLKARSTELEERYRKIISLCTGAEEQRVDDLLDNLVQAVVSEQKEEVELGRVRDFLRLVKGD